jgi:hypothetical protein
MISQPVGGELKNNGLFHFRSELRVSFDVTIR